jgi:hypothetical protein
MDGLQGYVFTQPAEQQLEDLVDSDIRFQLVPEEFYWLALRSSEHIGILKEIEGEAVYVFVTPEKNSGPSRVAITYRIITEQVMMVQILDIRLLPVK